MKTRACDSCGVLTPEDDLKGVWIPCEYKNNDGLGPTAMHIVVLLCLPCCTRSGVIAGLNHITTPEYPTTMEIYIRAAHIREWVGK